MFPISIHAPRLTHKQPTPQKPFKLMSQQEKLAMKATQKHTSPTITGDSSSEKTPTKPKKEDKDNKLSNQLLRPSTPLGQIGSSWKDDSGNSPCSQACTSGTVTPTSEGVKRADRKVMHAPPGGLDL